jgi:hypothetical protein
MVAKAAARLRFSLGAAIALTALLPVTSGGCKRNAAEASTDAGAVANLDGGGELVAIAMPDAGASTGAASVMLHALALITPVLNEPEWPARDPSKTSDERKGATRLGYLRKGDTVAARSQLLKKANCPEGWYELLPLPGAPAGSSGGFVCGKYATIDPADKELASAPHAPNLAGPLPYDYGLNIVDGAPLYNRPPRPRERSQYERGLEVGRTSRKKSGDDDARGPGTAGADDDTAWYLTHKDRSQISMDDLKSETALIEHRMVKGFYLGLDREVRLPPTGRFWRTTHGNFVPKEFVLVHDPKVEFQGVWLDAPGETRHLPLGWITNPHQWRYTLSDDTSAGSSPGESRKKVHRHESADRFTIVPLTGKRELVDQKEYWETEEGWWMRAMDGTVTNPGPPPKDVAPGERWIDVNLGKQTLVAFEGSKPVFATLVSSGRHDDDDPAKDHRTRPGEFRVREKHVSATMDNDTATDGPYSIEDVPWIMYFDGSTALHGAFWHSRFGHERSHGCVNMTPHDAHELFGWVGPRLPDDWHGVRATEANPGTRILVHDDGKTAEESRKAFDDARGPRAGDVAPAAPQASPPPPPSH